MAKKIGYDTVAGGSVPPPIDSSLEGAPVQSAVQQPVQQPVKATTPPPVDSSLAGAPGATQSTEDKQQEASTNTVKPGAGTSTDTDKPGAGASADTPKEGTGASTDKENTGNGTSTDYSNDVMGYNDQIALLRKEQARYEEANETPEQQAKREKREKSQRLMAAIGDGLRSLSNLYFTSQYAPNAYDPTKDSNYEKEDARLKELKAEREANRDKYLNYALKIGDLENERASTVRELEAQAEKMKIAREEAARKAQKHQWEAEIQPERQRKATADADAAESNATIKATEAKYAPGYYQNRNNLQEEKINTEHARQGSLRASATNSYAAARAHDRSNQGGSSSGSKGGKGGKVYGTFLGKTYTSKADYEGAIVDYARRNGIPLQYEKVNKDKRGRPKGSTPTNRTIAGLKSSAEEHYARTHTPSDNTPPSRRRSNDNTPPSRR